MSEAPTTRARFIARGDGPAATLNAPNLITIIRILLVPVFVVLLAADGGHDIGLRWAATALFVVAISTDSLDGHLARSRNLVTDLGKLLDPIADKALIGSALVVLSVLGELPWAVTVLILVREVGITVYRFAVLSRRVIPASKGGKLKTVLQAVAITLALTPLQQLLGSWVTIPDRLLMAAALVVTLATGVQYLVDDRRLNGAA